MRSGRGDWVHVWSCVLIPRSVGRRMVHGHLCSQWGPRHRCRSGKHTEQPQCREEEATPVPAGSAMARSVGERVAASHLSTVQLSVYPGNPNTGSDPSRRLSTVGGGPGGGQVNSPGPGSGIFISHGTQPSKPDKSESVLVVSPIKDCSIAQPRTYCWPMPHSRARAGPLRERLLTLRRDTRK